MLEDNYTELFENRESKSIREVVDVYLKHWLWFVIAAILSVTAAVIYLKYATPTYRSVASIIINDEESSSSGLAGGFSEASIFGGLGTNSITNELGLLRSKRLMHNTVRSLDLQVQYYDANEELNTPEIYSDSPLVLDVLDIDETLLAYAGQEGKDVFQLKNSGDSDIIQFFNPITKKNNLIKFDSIIDIGYLNFKVKRNPAIKISKNKENNVYVKVVSSEQVVNNYRNKINIGLVEENATLIELSIIDPVRQKGKDVINQLIFEYNREAIEDKNLVAVNTASFIDDRLRIINKELDSVEVGKEEFKEVNRLTNIDAESQLILQNASEYAVKEQEVGTQLGLVNSMIRYLQKEETGLLPANLGIDEVNINSMIDEYNSLVLERDRILAGATITNPIVVKLSNQIQRLKNNVKKSLARKKSNLRISKRDIQKQSGILGSQISEVPLQERLFRSIERQQNIKEALYLFLLQKREENSLSLAATAPKAKIVDQAYSVGGQVFPNPKKTVILYLFIGLFIPFVGISISSLLNNKIRNKKDLEDLTRIPILGELPHLRKIDEQLVKENDRSTLSETLRILISNLYYTIDQSKHSKSNVILVTSSLKGEGKTFATVNLAKMLAINDKKTVLIGADLRNPQLGRYDKNIKNKNGLSNYLASTDVKLDSIITDTELHKNLQIIPSGPIPPNPAELLAKDRVSTLFEELKGKFDYILVDTPPSMILADTYLINKHADLALYMVRAGVTKKEVIKELVETKKSERFSNVGIILNDIKVKDYGYGRYEYTYGEEVNKNRFLSFLKGKIKF